MLLVAALIWGTAFVAQSVGVEYLDACTFIFVRCLIGGFSLLPVIWFFDQRQPLEKRQPLLPLRKNKKLLLGGICCGIFLGFASILQQIGIEFTTVGKCGFITAFYVIFVPVIGFFFLHRKYHFLTWLGVTIALFGLYFLSLKPGTLQISFGDLCVFFSAILFSLHILTIDHFSPMVDGIRMSCLQFFVAGIVAGIGMLLFEHPQLNLILAAWKPILYCGIMSNAVAYTIQVVCQKGVEPTVASLALSMESVFSVLSGWLILHELLSGRELLGCLFMFIAVVLVQLSPSGKQSNLVNASETLVNR